ncbi:MAG: carboxymuconolactone decarboxylase family protein [Bradyrhizobium sp.]|nr:MAG: carboxymuconolactone decarboxylase family protein [Bradyrhizobium sp.]
MSYADRADMRLVKDLTALAPVEAKGYFALSDAAERADGRIPPKYRELMSIAVALTTQCAYCLDVHTKRALAAGASREEIAEAAFIASALRAGAAAAHGLLALKLYDEHAAVAS